MVLMCSKRGPSPKAPAKALRRVRRPAGGAPMYDLIELMFFAYRDFVGDADHLLAALGLWPGAPPGLAFRFPAAWPDHRRIAGYFENHQAESQSRPQGTARSGLCRGPPGHARTAASANCFQRRAARLSRSMSRSCSRNGSQRCSPGCRKGRAPQAIAFLLAMVDAERARQGRRDDRCQPAPPVAKGRNGERAPLNGASDSSPRRRHPPTMPRIF